MKMNAEAVPGASLGAESKSSQSPQPEGPPGPQPEKIFGKDVITPADLAKISGEVKGQLEQNTPAAAFKAAQQLAHLKRAQVELGNNREDVLERLDAQRERLVEKTEADDSGASVLARYLTYRKYLGGEGKSFKTTDQEQEVMRRGILARATEPERGSVTQLAVEAKYLGMATEPGAIAKRVQAEVSSAAKAAYAGARDSGQFEHLVLLQAGAKYLGVEASIESVAGKPLESELNNLYRDYKAAGDWEKAARLKRWRQISGEQQPVYRQDQEKMVSHAATIRDDTRRYAEYVGNLSGLDRKERGRKEKIEAGEEVVLPLHLANLSDRPLVETKPDTSGEAEPAVAEPPPVAKVTADQETAAPEVVQEPPPVAELVKPPVVAELVKPPVVAELVKPPVVAELVKPPPVAKVTGEQETAAPEVAETKVDPKSTAGGESFVIEVGAHIPGTGAREVSGEGSPPAPSEEVVTAEVVEEPVTAERIGDVGDETEAIPYARFRDKEGNIKPPVVKPPIIAESTAAAAAETQTGEAAGDDMSVFEGMETHGQRRVREYIDRKKSRGIFTRAWQRLFGPRPQGQSWSRWQKVRRSQSGFRGLFFRGRKRRKAFEARYGTDSEAKKYLGDLAEQERVQENTKLAAQDKKPSDSDSVDSNLTKAA